MLELVNDVSVPAMNAHNGIADNGGGGDEALIGEDIPHAKVFPLNSERNNGNGFYLSGYFVVEGDLRKLLITSSYVRKRIALDTLVADGYHIT